MTKKVPLIIFGSATDAVFVYPDFVTALKGNFIGGQMVTAKVAPILNLEKNLKTTSSSTSGSRLPKLIVGEPSGAAFERDVSDATHLSHEPLLRDPYEAKTVEVKKAHIYTLINCNIFMTCLNKEPFYFLGEKVQCSQSWTRCIFNEISASKYHCQLLQWRQNQREAGFC